MITLTRGMKLLGCEVINPLSEIYLSAHTLNLRRNTLRCLYALGRFNVWRDALDLTQVELIRQ
jgi:hypothetical protein